jgi:hypothetical protein
MGAKKTTETPNPDCLNLWIDKTVQLAMNFCALRYKEQHREGFLGRKTVSRIRRRFSLAGGASHNST